MSGGVGIRLARAECDDAEVAAGRPVGRMNELVPDGGPLVNAAAPMLTREGCPADAAVCRAVGGCSRTTSALQIGFRHQQGEFVTADASDACGTSTFAGSRTALALALASGVTGSVREALRSSVSFVACMNQSDNGSEDANRIRA
ncbi:hypothetical protein [Actinoplanes sp. NPDC026623]|uniref:hypothetical protein n=1 Tax=Actinoplanes sp. NPDC026623 TaxID=3155610 RepID=UPI0033D20118